MDLQAALVEAVNRPGSLNRITVDSDQSTSDTCFLISSDKVKASSGEDVAAFREALAEVCAELAEDVVRNGEGTHHVIRVDVKGSPTLELAHGAGKAIANSPLVKTAIYGNDPNVGRIIAALGSYLGRQPSGFVAKRLPERTTVKVGGVTVFERGEFTLTPVKEAQLHALMKDAFLDYSKGPFPGHFNVVDVEVDLNGGDAPHRTRRSLGRG